MRRLQERVLLRLIADAATELIASPSWKVGREKTRRRVVDRLVAAGERLRAQIDRRRARLKENKHGP